MPDARTIWRFRKGLKSSQGFDSLFAHMMSQVEKKGYIARKGQIVDASVVRAPRQRNRRDENAQVKRGEIPQDWSQKKRRHEDVDARWTRKHGVSCDGYKNHVSVDREFGLVGGWEVTDASCHDSRLLGRLLDETNTSGGVWGDCAYFSREHEHTLRAGGW